MRVENGADWFKERGRWLDGSAEPSPGMIVFFDCGGLNGSGPRDGKADRAGVVERVENGTVYVVEGDCGDAVRRTTYPLTERSILGCGAPAY